MATRIERLSDSAGSKKTCALKTIKKGQSRSENAVTSGVGVKVGLIGSVNST